MKELAAGEVMVVKGRGGWIFRLTGTDSGADVRVSNPTDDEREKFYSFDTAGNPYGAGMVFQEPSLGIPLKEVGVKIDGSVVGALVMDAAGKVVERYSWTNLVFVQDREYDINSEGELLVDGVSKGFLNVVFLADKNRLVGYVGVFTPNKPDTVKLVEMEDLLVAEVVS